VSADLPGGWEADAPGDRPDTAPGPGPGELAGGSAPSEPGLDALLGVLTAGPTPGELAGEAAALAMFRSSRRAAAALPGPFPPEHGGPGPRAPGWHAPRPHAPGRAPSPRTTGWRTRSPRRLAAAVTLAAAAGIAAAAYTEALPAPLQHVAYGVLGFAGVPDTKHAGLATVSPGPATPGPARPAGHSPGAAQPPSASASPRPGASPPGPPLPAVPQALSVTVASGRIVAGGSETFTGLLADHGRPVAGASLSLQERQAGERTWHPVSSVTTGADGRVVVIVPDLTRNAGFRLAGPHRALSRPVLVIVVPPVSASVASRPAGQGGVLTASSPLASPGNAVVLQVWTGMRWRNVQTRNLNGARQVTFVVRVPGAGREYRMVLLATAAHGLSLSNTVTTPLR
jgi:hypothetical protein